MPYVYVERDDPKCDLYLKAEDPQYAAQMGLTVDSLHYLHHQVLNPLAILFDPILGEDAPEHQHLSEKTRDDKRNMGITKKLMATDDVQRLLCNKNKAEAIRRRDFLNKKNKQQIITSFFKR